MKELAVAFAALAIALSAAAADTVQYRLTVSNTWSEATHPGAFPVGAHFSFLGGATHDASVSFWEEGEFASPGIVRMAETGNTIDLVAEVESAIAAGAASEVLSWQYGFCPAGTTSPNCGPPIVHFDVVQSYPLVTLVTMLGPSPDWFVGVSGLPMREGGQWRDRIVVDLHPYDGGTRDANVFALGGPLTTPPDPISLITAASGQLVGPGLLGTFTFERVSEPVPMLPVPMLPVPFLAALAIGLCVVGAAALSRNAGT